MGSIVSNAQAAAATMSRRVSGQLITFRRGDTELTIDLAVQGSTKWFLEQIDNGVHAAERSVDWIISVTDLTLPNGTVLEPARGDEIIDEHDAVYRVMPFGPDELLWRWHDRESHTAYRIFTKERT